VAPPDKLFDGTRLSSGKSVVPSGLSINRLNTGTVFRNKVIFLRKVIFFDDLSEKIKKNDTRVLKKEYSGDNLWKNNLE
jgi:hypothetical protein